MKKFIATIFCIALMANVAACKNNSQSADMITDFDSVPVLIDRSILTDAVWGIGEEIPTDVACVAGSQFVFDASRSSFNIAINNIDDYHYVEPVIIISSLNIYLPAHEIGTKAETCPIEDLYYLVSATENMPIDIAVAGENCVALEEIATEEGVSYPTSGTVKAHFEPSEIDPFENVKEGEDEEEAQIIKGDSEEEVAEGEEQSGEDDEDVGLKVKMFKLVVDECYPE